MEKIEKIRISIGSAGVLGLKNVVTDAPPTTCYLLTYAKRECRGACLFCPQGNFEDKNNAKRLSRIQWPVFSMDEFLNKFEKFQQGNGAFNKKRKKMAPFQRVCLQIVNFPGFFPHVVYILKQIHKKAPNTPISLASPPIEPKKMEIIKNLGAERICFALDACTEPLFRKIKGKGAKGPYEWKMHRKRLGQAKNIFGKGKVTTHFIVGLGESEREMVQALYESITNAILPGIFLFTPVRGTPYEHKTRPDIVQFRHIQLARYLLLKNPTSWSRFQFSRDDGELFRISGLKNQELQEIINKQVAFKTAGCPGCNRPYYTARPGEEQDGFPKGISKEDRGKIYEELKDLIDE